MNISTICLWLVLMWNWTELICEQSRQYAVFSFNNKTVTLHQTLYNSYWFYQTDIMLIHQIFQIYRLVTSAWYNLLRHFILYSYTVNQRILSITKYPCVVQMKKRQPKEENAACKKLHNNCGRIAIKRCLFVWET